MSNVVKLHTDETPEDLWKDFADKSATAQKSLKFEDGLAARQAWIRFIDTGDDI